MWLLAAGVIFSLFLGIPALPLSGFCSIKSVHVEQQARQPRIQVSLLTFSPGDKLFEWFGHTALAVTDNRTGKSTAYNFGGFSFGTDDFLKFIMGQFVFWSYKENTRQVIRSYRKRGRHIIIQKLDLTPRQTSRIRLRLVRSMLPENHYYTYDHFRDNCAIRLRDIVDDALGGAIREQSNDTTGRTYRDYVHRMTVHLPALNFLINFVLSDGVDKPVSYWDTMFLPDRLMDVFQNVTNPATGRPLVRNRDEIVPHRRSTYFTDNAAIPSSAVRDWSVGLIQFFLIALASWFYIRQNSATRTWRDRGYPMLVSLFGAVYGLLGVVLFFMTFIGSHKDVYWNENFLLLNPLTFLLFPLGVLRVLGRSKRTFATISIICGTGAVLELCLKLLPCFNQVNGQQLVILLPGLVLIGGCGLLDLRNEIGSPLNSRK